jgi:hypothetical protein
MRPFAGMTTVSVSPLSRKVLKMASKLRMNSACWAWWPRVPGKPLSLMSPSSAAK